MFQALKLEAEEQQRQADSLITESDHGVNGQKSVGDVTDGFLMRRSRFMLLVILICMMLAATIAASGFLLAVLMLLGLVGSAILLFESRVPHPTVDDNSMV